MAQQWEYKALTLKAGDVVNDLTNVLNQHGAEGWELVSAASSVKQLNVTGNDYVMIFKRPGVGPFRPADAVPT